VRGCERTERTPSFRKIEALACGQTKTWSWRSFLSRIYRDCFFFFKEKEEEKIISMFFFLAKRTKSQEKVIGQRAMPDAAPLPFPARAPLLVLVNRKEKCA
jgi:hypothetical protein